jgi:hypothetical protein
MKEVFRVMPRSRVALETRMHSPWVSRLLGDWGEEVIVAHARNVRLIGESRRKGLQGRAWSLPRARDMAPFSLNRNTNSHGRNAISHNH